MSKTLGADRFKKLNEQERAYLVDILKGYSAFQSHKNLNVSHLPFIRMADIEDVLVITKDVALSRVISRKLNTKEYRRTRIFNSIVAANLVLCFIQLASVIFNVMAAMTRGVEMSQLGIETFRKLTEHQKRIIWMAYYWPEHKYEYNPSLIPFFDLAKVLRQLERMKPKGGSLRKRRMRRLRMTLTSPLVM